jgi:arabinofuranosyltransferase
LVAPAYRLLASDLLAPRLDRRLASLLWLLLFIVVWRNAWLCEDAYITYRVVDNCVHGYGLRWNPLERVQVYTHPLWMLLLVPIQWVRQDMYFSAMTLSLACSALAMYLLLFRGLRSTLQCVVAVSVAICSKGFIDYSTGGLENPLSHVLIALFFLAYLREGTGPRLSTMVLWAGLALVNRLDLVWIFLPAIVHQAIRERGWRPCRWHAWLGLLPVVAWEAFSVLYYGFAFPNTAYAKLSAHVGWRNYVNQGLEYFDNSIAWDPVTLAAIAALCLMCLRRFKRDRELGCLGLGALLYLAYVMRVGGDYMSGRFFTAPLFASFFALSRVDFEGALQPAVILTGIFGLGLTSPRPPVMTNDGYQGLGHSAQAIDDEHGYRHGDTSILLLNREHNLESRGGWVGDGIHAKESGARVTVYRNIGYYGFFAGPGVHVIDPYGIGDPLMARLPFTDSSGGWTAGHFLRKVPDGYEKVAIDEGVLEDPEVNAYWKKLELVTRGRVFDPARLRMIVRFNLGMEPAPWSKDVPAKTEKAPNATSETVKDGVFARQ